MFYPLDEEKGGRVVYTETTIYEKRTDASFRARIQPEHHIGESLFEQLAIDMVNDFPIDYMHQVCLGVMKKLLLLWIKGPKKHRMSVNQIYSVSSHLLSLSCFIPNCFARKPRALSDVDRWKATEFRQFLLYTGGIVLKPVLADNMYDNFMSLSVAISILVSPELTSVHANYAQRLITFFLQEAHNIYGSKFFVYNVHSLLHITNDAVKFGSLDNCSAFAFENKMQMLKKMTRSGKRPIVQVAKRIAERDSACNTTQSTPAATTFATKSPNNAFILPNGSCVEVIKRCENQSYKAHQYKHCAPLFTNPCDSSLLSFYKTSFNFVVRYLHERDLCHKAILIKEKDHLIFLKLHHS